MIPESVPDVVSGDPYRLRQILLKLLGNAVKFTERGSVTIAVELEAPAEAPHRLRFAVSDTGIGIPPEHQSQIFNAFAQADTSATRRHGGAGLGLAICARLVQGMGGQIALESSPGAGSTFRFSLPLYANAAPETTADAPGHHLRGLRALVVGTAQAGGQPLETLLQAWGMASRSMSSVAEAGTALDAARAEGQPVDLVVLGSQAAGEDGCATAELLRKHAGATHIVVVTAAGLRGDAARCRKLGVSAYLTQPVSNRDLLEALQLVMRRNRKSQAQELVTRHSLRERRRHLTLLLAGGDPAGRKFALRLLRKLGHHATLAFDGRDAVEHARREVFDAILIDLDTPDGGGIDVARQIRTLDPGRPTPARVIALTARSVAGDRSEYHAASIDAFISKPLEMFRLAQVLDGIEHPSGTAPAFDRRAVLDNLGGDTELLQALATTFLDTHGDSLEKLRAAVRGGDWEGSYRAAHALKGAAGNFSATAVIDAALAVERSARKGDAAETRAAARDLESRIDALADALREEFDAAPLAA
jgi:CheY-like chemotaxis protein